MTTDKTTIAYDHTAVRFAERVVYPLKRELARFREMVPSRGLVLDVGCGPGQYARVLGGWGFRVMALDLSHGMLCQAQMDETPHLVRADMRRLPTGTESANGCFVCASLLHLPRSQALYALTEFRRVLHLGGALYVAVKEGRGEKWLVDQQGYERFFSYYQPEEFDGFIRAAGFEIVDGWISPPEKDQCYNWINRFAMVGK
ncbi:MAG: class I SAM-dependent methyltransferase [Chloroflexi bacterium]|nr:class I SAM-dependent methyltransferase [Chloroflexota bacterium]